jgi:hypothetical protein
MSQGLGGQACTVPVLGDEGKLRQSRLDHSIVIRSITAAAVITRARIAPGCCRMFLITAAAVIRIAPVNHNGCS